jgi:hypothetical protein
MQLAVAYADTMLGAFAREFQVQSEPQEEKNK